MYILIFSISVHQMQQSCESEGVLSPTDEDENAVVCHQRHMSSRKRRRPPGAGNGVVGPSHHHPHPHPHNMRSRVDRRGGRRELSGSDLDERDHAPPKVTIPVTPKCCVTSR